MSRVLPSLFAMWSFEAHLRSIYRKLGVPSRAAAAKEALERRLI